MKSVKEWIDLRRKLPEVDMDDLTLITGPERAGKSTLALQLNRALDPGFSIENIAFDVEEFIEKAKRAPPGSTLQLDEALISRRRAMHATNVRLLDFLQVCGGLRHHLSIIFPHAGFVDSALLENRVRWRVHVPGPDELGRPATERPGVFVVYEAFRRSVLTPDKGPVAVTRWRKVGSWRFSPRHDELEESYRKAKEAFMRRQIDAATGEEEEELIDPETERLLIAMAKDGEREALRILKGRRVEI